MDSRTLTVPLSFPTCLNGNTPLPSNSALAVSCCLALASCLVTLGDHANAPPEPFDFPGQSSFQGAAIGCLDGSIYIFRPRFSAASLIRNVESLASGRTEIAGNLSPLRYAGLGKSHSRSASPSSTKSTTLPFHMPPSRVISSVSTELVEAPKNYVDFDDEPERLKGLLKGRTIKERIFNDTLSQDDGKMTSTDRPMLSTTRTRRGLSPATSMRSTPPPSSPSSPTAVTPSSEREVASLSLFCHIVPSANPSKDSVVALASYNNGRHLICLQQSGNVTIYSTLDGSCLASARPDEPLTCSTAKATSARAAPILWTWKNLHISSVGELQIVVACASGDASTTTQSVDTADGDLEFAALMIVYEMRTGPQLDGSETALVKIGEWLLDGYAESVGLLPSLSGTLMTFHLSPSRRLIRRVMGIDNRPSPSANETSASSSHATLPISNPFRALKPLSRERLPEEIEKCEESRNITLSEPSDLGDICLIGPPLGTRTTSEGQDVHVLYWSEGQILVLNALEHSSIVLASLSLNDIEDVDWTGTNSFIVIYSDRADIHRLLPVDPNNDPDPINGPILHAELIRGIPLPTHEVSRICPDGKVLSTGVKNGQRRMEISLSDGSVADTKTKIWTVWKSPRELPQLEPHVTSMLPLDFDKIILGCNDGLIRCLPFIDLVKSCAVSQVSNVPLQGRIVSLHIVENEITKERLIVGGADDGTIAIWASKSLHICASWTIFTVPLVRMIDLHGENTGPLKSCLLCISGDGTIAVVAIDDLQLLFLIPASIVPLRSVHIRDTDMMLVYADDRARLWDSKTAEFRRSMLKDKADEALEGSTWTGWILESQAIDSGNGLTTFSNAPGLDSASTLLLDVESMIRLNNSSLLSSRTSTGKPNLERLRVVLATVLTPGLNKEIDAICREKLKIDIHYVPMGLSTNRSSSLYGEQGLQSPWSISPEVSASRSLALVALLQTLLHTEESASDVNTVIMFYTTSLTEVVGSSYKAPSLPYLAMFWLRTLVSEVRSSARLLFDAGVARLTSEEASELVEIWRQFLPCFQADSDKDSFRSAMALHVCGFVAVDKYSLLSTTLLTDISKSIALFLHEEGSPWRFLAIDLCSRGFTLWQQYVDAVDMLRALFTLATSTRKEAISPHNIGSQARIAVLHIASTNTPLFMTTLTIDILQPRSVQHRKCVMQLVIFMIRKNPLILYNNLPRLVEAVVKSLDPNSTSNRDAVLDSATEILGHVVQTFPSVDFHMPTQRLAVGTSEGAVVMYDLKTATRLYVLEGHKKRTTACSFSPDGRRLVTLSLDELVLLVWKVGSSFTSFFNPGAPPRQGHGGSEPFRTFSFNIGDEGNMPLAATLNNVKFEWPADRSVRLKIREITLTFST